MKALKKDLLKNYELYIFMIPATVYFLLFCYFPMYGVQIAFKDYIPTLGFLGSKWVGFAHFRRFFQSYHFWTLIRNTIGISVYELAVSFPLPILFALLLNEIRHARFKKFAQTITYAPYFISTVVLVGMLMIFLSPTSGIVNRAIVGLGGQAVDFLTRPRMFKSIYVLSGAWQMTGWGSIIYLAVLSGIDPSLYEASRMDGASKLQKILHIDIPGLLPTAIILLILNSGRIMSVGFEKIYLMQNPLNMTSSDVIATYIYRAGLLDAEFGFATAVGLFNAAVNLLLLVAVNQLARRLGETSLW